MASVFLSIIIVISSHFVGLDLCNLTVLYLFSYSAYLSWFVKLCWQFVEKLARHLKECLRDGAFESVRILVSKFSYCLHFTVCTQHFALCVGGSQKFLAEWAYVLNNIPLSFCIITSFCCTPTVINMQMQANDSYGGFCCERLHSNVVACSFCEWWTTTFWCSCISICLLYTSDAADE